MSAAEDVEVEEKGGAHLIMSEQEKKEKEHLLMFIRVLMKYLEQRDVKMHATARAQIEECYAKNKARDSQFSSLTTSMKARLRATVGESYWKKADDYLAHFLEWKRQSHEGEEEGGDDGSGDEGEDVVSDIPAGLATGAGTPGPGLDDLMLSTRALAAVGSTDEEVKEGADDADVAVQLSATSELKSSEVLRGTLPHDASSESMAGSSFDFLEDDERDGLEADLDGGGTGIERVSAAVVIPVDILRATGAQATCQQKGGRKRPR